MPEPISNTPASTNAQSTPAPAAPAAPQAPAGGKKKAADPVATAPIETPQVDPNAEADLRAAKLVEDIRAGKFDETPDDLEGAEQEAASGEGDEPEPGDAEETAEPPKPKEAHTEDEDPAEKARIEALEKEAAAEREKRKTTSEREKIYVEREKRFQADVARFQQDVQQAQQQVERAWQTLQQRDAAIAAREAAFDDPAQLYALVSEKIPAEQLAKLIEDGLNPSNQAAWAAKRAQQEARKQLDPELAALREQVTKLTQHFESVAERDRRQNAEQAFAARTNEMAAEIPLAAKLLQRNPTRYFAMAHQAADDLRRQHGSTDYEMIAKVLEEELRSYQLHELPQPGPEAASQTDIGPNPAPATKARTLTNRATAGRSSILDDDREYASVDDHADAIKAAIRGSRPKT